MVKIGELTYKEFSNKPTEFEITFIMDNVRYEYGFSLTSERIIHEFLLSYVKPKPRRLFEREYDYEKDTYNWYIGSYLLEPEKIKIWKELTNSNSLFISIAAHSYSNQLTPIFNYMTCNIILLDTCYTNYIEKYKDEVINLLNILDVEIIDIIINKDDDYFYKKNVKTIRNNKYNEEIIFDINNE